MEQVTMTYEQQEQARAERLAEKGTMPPCPLCGRPRVERSDYIRCNPCGVNWLNGENLDKNPKIERYDKMVESQRKPVVGQGTKSSSATE